jgi:hypothetical protein
MEENRRKYERVKIEQSSGIYATDDVGKRIGPVRELGLGGMLVDTKLPCREGDMLSLVLVDDSEGIRRHVKTISCYKTPGGVGFHFHGLDPQAAVEVGVIIGKHQAGKA